MAENNFHNDFEYDNDVNVILVVVVAAADDDDDADDNNDIVNDSVALISKCLLYNFV